MLQVAVLLQRSTLRVLNEHSVTEVGGAFDLSPTEALVLLDAETLQVLLGQARPEDSRLDDVIMRLAL
jgi:hypothetical protein